GAPRSPAALERKRFEETPGAEAPHSFDLRRARPSGTKRPCRSRGSRTYPRECNSAAARRCKSCPCQTERARDQMPESRSSEPRRSTERLPETKAAARDFETGHPPAHWLPSRRQHTHSACRMIEARLFRHDGWKAQMSARPLATQPRSEEHTSE